MEQRGKLIIFSAPSGSGKSTIIQSLLNRDLNLSFSISATSRAPRGTEKNGIEYYFITPDEFRERIANDEFLEYEEVYAGKFYGTLKSEVERILDSGKNVIFDVDVVGGLNIKKILREPSSRFIYSATQHTSVGTTIEKQSDRYPGSYSPPDSES